MTKAQTTYAIRVVDMDVYLWGEDGEGERVCSKGGYTVWDRYGTAEEMMTSLQEYFPGIELEQCENGFLGYDQIEDENGYADENGGFLTRYLIAVEKITIESYVFEENRL